jgi:hydroxymethylglutaryl-CoA reductase (NADPH)
MLSVISNAISKANPQLRTITLDILPPVFFKSLAITSHNQSFLDQSEAAVDGFLEAWTNHVGDPVISKWIVVVLCMSMSLNAWLLSAARRGAMHPPVVSSKPLNRTADFKSKQEIHPPAPAIAITRDKVALNSTAAFRLDADESDDDEKRVAAIKGSTRRVRSATECLQILNEGHPSELLDEEVIALTLQKKIPLYALEKTLKDCERAVKVRRAVVCMSPLSSRLL